MRKVKKKPNLTCEQLNDMFVYDPSDITRPLVRKTTHKKTPYLKGARAGSITTQGYVHVGIKGFTYKLHRLIYMLAYDVDYEDVPSAVDHTDRNILNNTKENLRDGTFLENNSYVNSRNRVSIGSSNYIGVSICDALRNKYQCTIMINQREVALLSYKSEISCAEYYKAACKHLGYEVDDCYIGVDDIVLPKRVSESLDKAVNTPVPEVKTSRYNGVSWSKQKQKFVGRINTYIDGKNRNATVGTYEDDYECAVRRDLLILDCGLKNPTSIVTKDTYHHFRGQFPVEQIKKVQLTLKSTGEVVGVFGGMTEIADTYHIDKKKIRAILEGRLSSEYKYDFKWVYENKKYPEYLYNLTYKRHPQV